MESMYNYAVLSNQLGDNDAALSAYDECVKAQPGHIDALLNSANIYLTRGDHDTAKRYVEIALSAHPDSALAKVHVGCWGVGGGVVGGDGRGKGGAGGERDGRRAGQEESGRGVLGGRVGR